MANEVKYQFEDVDELPTRAKSKKGSKYDPIITAFHESDRVKAKVSIESDKDANYLRTQLKKRIDARELTDMDVSVIAGEIYLIRDEE